MENINQVKVKLDNSTWVDARNYQINAMYTYDLQYIESSYIYNKDGYYFSIGRLNNNPYNPIYLSRLDGSGTRIPIADWSNVKAFLSNGSNGSNWYDVPYYLKWAYFHFIYGSDETKKYSSHSVLSDTQLIPSTNESYDDFIISRNDNSSIFYQFIGQSRIRISDNPRAQNGYLGFFRRVTDDIPFILEPPNSNYLKLPLDICISKTTNDSVQCCICNINTHNIKFQPCQHTSTCSECYLKLQKARTCPYCRQTIKSIDKYNPA